MTTDRATGRMKGPVIERRGQIHDGSTTDQRLLDSRGSTDWLHTDPWRLVTVVPLTVPRFRRSGR